ncbi:hypothetical protein LNTAR_05121 [Lentisphaera araneosa HTCC2155]|uniref:DUF3817 domain-containing protein n=1 Tax=Lentisphaera araneosa HTCC2155 TaxID=313628 RepID=A6DLL1_9BACT|nr:DUF3817 domain-containing protein [Lentisphaera araneosa]EDM27466.1 hypothetical protein LNTAR_05121 [Lentisphaera araneosa HTCC2155]
MIDLFKKVAFWEGVSYLLLVFVAMPMKYLAGYPQAVRIVGMAHGVLFVMFCLILADLLRRKEFTFNFSVFAFIMSILPFGTFYLEGKIKSA